MPFTSFHFLCSPSLILKSHSSQHSLLFSQLQWLDAHLQTNPTSRSPFRSAFDTSFRLLLFSHMKKKQQRENGWLLNYKIESLGDAHVKTMSITNTQDLKMFWAAAEVKWNILYTKRKGQLKYFEHSLANWLLNVFVRKKNWKNFLI